MGDDLTLEEMDNILSSLGMLSEPCRIEVSNEELELLSNRRRLSSLASQLRKERHKQTKESAKLDLLQRKRKKESESLLYTPTRRDKAGHQIGKRKNAFGSKKQIASAIPWEDDDEDEDEELLDYYWDGPDYSTPTPGGNLTLPSIENVNQLSEEEQLQLALELSLATMGEEELPMSDQMQPLPSVDEWIPASVHIPDVRCTSDIEEGMLVEVVLPGMKETRQRTKGIVIRVVSLYPWEEDGVLVELEHGVQGHVTGLIDAQFIPSQLSLGVPTPLEKPSQPSPESREVLICPAGCKGDLSGLNNQEMNDHITHCLQMHW